MLASGVMTEAPRPPKRTASETTRGTHSLKSSSRPETTSLVTAMVTGPVGVSGPLGRSQRRGTPRRANLRRGAVMMGTAEFPTTPPSPRVS
jgi:hypothetical protein